MSATEFTIAEVSEELRIQAVGTRGATVDMELTGARLFDTLRDAERPMPRPDEWEGEARSLDAEGQRRLSILVEASRATRLAPVVRSCLRGAPDAFAAYTVLAREESRLLTVELLATSPFRTEEFARKWVRRLRGTIRGETEAESDKQLERLDFGGVLGNLKKAEAQREERMKKLRDAEERRKKEEAEAYARMGRE